MIDSHCHLLHRRYAEEPALGPEALVQNAAQAGVNTLLAIACERDEWHPALGLAERQPGVFVAAGIHPASAGEGEKASLDELLKLAKHPRLIAYGETGLDAKEGEAPSPAQVEMFKIHLEAAHQTGLPVSLHTRDAEDAVLEIIKNFPDVGFVYHCFTGTAEQAAKVVEAGGYVSLSGIVTFSNAKALQAVALNIPLDRLLLETDAPYLAPTPFRGKRNEPVLVAEVYKYVASQRHIPLPELTRQVAANFQRLFPRAKIS